MSALSGPVAVRPPLAPVNAQQVQAVKNQKEQMLDSLANKVIKQINEILGQEVNFTSTIPDNKCAEMGVKEFTLEMKDGTKEKFGLRVGLLQTTYIRPGINKDLEALAADKQKQAAFSCFNQIAQLIHSKIKDDFVPVYFLAATENNADLRFDLTKSLFVKSLIWKQLFPK